MNNNSILQKYGYHWIPPPRGTLEINVHATTATNPTRFDNNTSIGAIYRDFGGKLRYLEVGVIQNLTPI